jgi:hypothetical protein
VVNIPYLAVYGLSNTHQQIHTVHNRIIVR